MTFRSTNPVSLEKLLTEQQNQNSADIDLKSTAEIVQIYHQEDRTALAADEAETAYLKIADRLNWQLKNRLSSILRKG